MAAQIAATFGLGGGGVLSAGPVARGKQGQIWRLNTDAGSWAIKEPFRRRTDADIRDAADFQQAAHDSGVPVPGVIRTGAGALLADIGPTQVRVYEWVDLRAPDITLDPVAVGSVVAAVHRIRMPNTAPLDTWFTEAVGADRWDQLIGQLRAAGAPFAGRLADARDELVALESWIEPPANLQSCHRDLWADNLLPTAEGGVCVIDWEDSGLADPSQELGCVLFEFAGGDPGRAGALYRAYVDHGGPGRVDRPGHFSMLIAQLGHIGEAACCDWLVPNPRSPDRSDSAAWFAEFVDRPHDRVVLREILDAVR